MKSRTVINILLKLYITLYLLFLTSCATLFNRTTTRVDIHTKYPATIIINEDTIKTTGNRAAFIVERSKNSLNVESKTDTLTKTFIVKPMLSSMFFNNFLIFPYGLAGAALDLISVKKYTYPSHIFINPQDKKKINTKSSGITVVKEKYISIFQYPNLISCTNIPSFPVM